MNSSELHRDLLTWYDAHRRRMPWREKTSPYRTWISEIMLQQTQVATVIPYFHRFVKTFPDIRSLARANEEKVLRHWAGLGYYSRARNLRRAAIEMCDRFAGRIPETLEDLKSLPGIGPYTAAAISSIAYGHPHELVDGNVSRVFARLFAERGNVKALSVDKRMWKHAAGLIHRHRPGDWNQAVMELGALICLPLPDSPRCGECPIKKHCLAKRANIQEKLPHMPIQRKPIHLSWTSLDIRKDGKRLLWKRDDNERFLRGHWGLPETRHLKNILASNHLRTVKHSITHHRISLEIRSAPPPTGTLPPQARWVTERTLPRYLVSSLWRKAAGLLK